MAALVGNLPKIIIVGGGFAGLAIAVRLSELGIPITLLEASSLGFDASSRNQGWLHSGALFAANDTDYATICYQSLEYIEKHYSACFASNQTGMRFLASDAETDIAKWTTAWNQAGIPYQSLELSDVGKYIPELDLTQIHSAFMLPDRVMDPESLLQQLGAQASQAGVEIRTETTVSHLVKNEAKQEITGVELGTDEIIDGQLVILATGAMGTNLWSETKQNKSGLQTNYRRVMLKTNLTSCEPAVSTVPFCIFDQAGFNHMPQENRSVFGHNKWTIVTQGEDHSVTESEKQQIWEKIAQYFPAVNQEDYLVKEWSGVSVQALHLDQVEPGVITRPTVINHAEESPHWKNLLSVYPGRATLWPQLADQTCEVVQQLITK